MASTAARGKYSKSALWKRDSSDWCEMDAAAVDQSKHPSQATRVRRLALQGGCTLLACLVLRGVLGGTNNSAYLLPLLLGIQAEFDRAALNWALEVTHALSECSA